MLPAVIAAKQEGWLAVVVPVENLAEAALVDGIEVHGARTLGKVRWWLNGAAELEQTTRMQPVDGRVAGPHAPCSGGNGSDSPDALEHRHAGSGTNGQVLGVHGTACIQTVPVSGLTIAGVYSAIADAVQLVHTKRFLPPTAIVMHPRRWAWFQTLLDTTNRPTRARFGYGPGDM